MSDSPFRQAFGGLVWIWCPDTGEMLWDDDGQLERKYYRSQHWLAHRRKQLRASGGCCQRCNRPFEWGIDRPRIHHLTYERLGRERLSDTQCVCEACHGQAHAEDRPGAVSPKIEAR